MYSTYSYKLRKQLQQTQTINSQQQKTKTKRNSNGRFHVTDITIWKKLEKSLQYIFIVFNYF